MSKEVKLNTVLQTGEREFRFFLLNVACFIFYTLSFNIRPLRYTLLCNQWIKLKVQKYFEQQ